MGKGGKAQTVGYKYYLGMHLGMCHGPIDNISRLRVDDRDAWVGLNTGGTINVNAANLFGGDKREGGVSGTIDVEMGRPTQGVNSYLASKLGALMPAYRGIVGLVFRQAYLGNNPYLKKWSARGQRIYVRQDGIQQWYPSRAAIGSLSGKHAVYIAMDCSGSMDELVAPGVTRLQNAKTALSGVMDYIGSFAQGVANIDIMVVAWGATRSSITRRNASAADITAIKNFINSRVTVGGTDFNQGVADVAGFYGGAPADAKRTVIFITDGEANEGTVSTARATLFATPGITSYGFNIDLNDTSDTAQMDNSPNDGVPVIHGDDSTSLQSAIQSILGNVLDMNPAHIIRECLTDPDWGMGYTDEDIDDASFEAAADRLVVEGLGMSLLWDKQIKIEEFVEIVRQHIDAALYVSRTTGKFVLKLIRGDYDEGDLLTLDESNIVEVSDPTRVSFGELTNSVTVAFWDAATGKDGSTTVTDTALVQQQGVVINSPLQYPGFTNNRNATIAGQRDLRALSSPLLSCTITADSDAKVLNIGDVFKFTWPKWGLYEVVMRISGISYGTGRNNRVKIQCSQDIFDTDTNVVITVPPPTWEDPSRPPTAAPDQLALEAPYWELVQVLGQSTIDAKLAATADIGYVLAAASRPSSAINASLHTDNGTGYEDVGALDFSPVGKLVGNISKTDLTIAVANFDDLDQVTIGSHFQIDDELMRVDAINTTTGEMTVGRGVLDTVPAEHFADATALFWDAFAGFDPTEYVMGEEVNAKITPVSGQGVLPLNDAPTMTVDIVGRAARPYPPGDLRVNGESYTPNAVYLGPVVVSWAHRDRLQQTSGVLVDYTAGNIGPEADTVYRLQAYIDDVLVFTEDDINGTETTWTPEAEGLIRVEVHSKRDGIYSLQAPSHIFTNSVAGALYTEEGDQRITEDGDKRYSE